MRDRLIELIKQGNGGYDFVSLKRIADHLLANGVIVPPCKVGDDIYWLNNETNEVECQKNDIKAVCYYGDGKFKVVSRCEETPEDIGTVWCFLTKEEAERALKEREQG
jgi:hypothetical protein